VDACVLRGKGARVAWLVARDSTRKLHKRRAYGETKGFGAEVIDFSGDVVRRRKLDVALVRVGWLRWVNAPKQPFVLEMGQPAIPDEPTDDQDDSVDGSELD